MKTGDVWSSRSFTATGNGFACADGSTGTSVESYAICVSTATVTAGNSCQNFTGNVESHGGYLHI